MGAFNAVDLENLPAPEVVESLNFESILEQMKKELILRDPSLELVLKLESEPLVKLLEVCAYRELMLRQRVNDASKSVMLAYATGSNLEQLALLFGIRRGEDPVTDEEGNEVVVVEDDRRLRYRVQLSLEGHSTAGAKGSYVFWALSASTRVKDVEVSGPHDRPQDISPGTVLVTILSNKEFEKLKKDGDQELIDTVFNKLDGSEVRPLTDRVIVRLAELIEYQVEAEIEVYSGPDQDEVTRNAKQKLADYVQEQYRLGENIYLSGLHAALHQPGVKRVELAIYVGENPDSETLHEESVSAESRLAQDFIDVAYNQAAFCSRIQVTSIKR